MAATVPPLHLFAAAVHWQDRTPTPQEYPEVAAFCRLEGRSLPFKPPLELCAGHLVNKCVHFASAKSQPSFESTHWHTAGGMRVPLFSLFFRENISEEPPVISGNAGLLPGWRLENSETPAVLSLFSAVFFG